MPRVQKHRGLCEGSHINIYAGEPSDHADVPSALSELLGIPDDSPSPDVSTRVEYILETAQGEACAWDLALGVGRREREANQDELFADTVALFAPVGRAILRRRAGLLRAVAERLRRQGDDTYTLTK